MRYNDDKDRMPMLRMSLENVARNFHMNKCKDGSVWSTGLSVYTSWEQDLENPVIAYRIIPEAKEESKLDEFLRKPQVWETELPDNHFAYRCGICKKGKHSIDGECDCGGSKKEPKKQTLLEFANHYYILGKPGEEFYNTISIISRYLEQSK